jgi:hypothetical protein
MGRPGLAPDKAAIALSPRSLLVVTRLRTAPIGVYSVDHLRQRGPRCWKWHAVRNFPLSIGLLETVVYRAVPIVHSEDLC